MTKGTAFVKYDRLNIAINTTRERYNEHNEYLEKYIKENWEEGRNGFTIKEQCENELIHETLNYFSKNEFFENYKNEHKAEQVCALVYNLKKFNDPKAIYEFIDEDFSTYRKKWAEGKRTDCEGYKIQEGIYSCARCGLKCYCSRECQLLDWKKHKVMCNSLIMCNTLIHFTKKDPV